MTTEKISSKIDVNVETESGTWMKAGPHFPFIGKLGY